MYPFTLASKWNCNKKSTELFEFLWKCGSSFVCDLPLLSRIYQREVRQPKGESIPKLHENEKNINEGGIPRAARSGTETFDIWYIYGPQSQDPQSLFHLLWLPDSVFVRDWYSHEYSKPTASNILKSMECLMLSEDHQYSSLHSGAMPSDCAFLEWLLPYFVGEQKWYSIKSFSGGQFDYFLFVFISRPVSSGLRKILWIFNDWIYILFYFLGIITCYFQIRRRLNIVQYQIRCCRNVSCFVRTYNFANCARKFPNVLTDNFPF